MRRRRLDTKRVFGSIKLASRLNQVFGVEGGRWWHLSVRRGGSRIAVRGKTRQRVRNNRRYIDAGRERRREIDCFGSGMN